MATINKSNTGKVASVTFLTGHLADTKTVKGTLALDEKTGLVTVKTGLRGRPCTFHRQMLTAITVEAPAKAPKGAAKPSVKSATTPKVSLVKETPAAPVEAPAALVSA